MTYANYQGSKKHIPVDFIYLVIYLDVCGDEKHMLNKQPTSTECVVIKIRP